MPDIHQLSFRSEPAFEEVLRLLGHKKHRTHVQPAIMATVQQLYADSLSLLQVDSLHLISELEPLTDATFRLWKNMMLHGKTAASIFQGATSALIAAVTLAPAFYDRLRTLGVQDQTLQLVILDAIGSAAVEEAAERLHRSVGCEIQAEGFSLSRRISPGYGDLPLTLQPTIAELLHIERIHLRVTPAMMLDPVKSITFFAALHRSESSKFRLPSCEECSLRDCSVRRDRS